MEALRIILILAIASMLQFSKAEEADWVVLDAAIANPGSANPEVLKNSILNIITGFVPKSPPAPVPSSTTAAVTSAPITTTTTQRAVQIQPIFIQQPQPQNPQTPLPAHIPYPVYWQNMGSSSSNTNCEKPSESKQKSIAEFFVNLPCPTTTPKPMRQIVVKVPCPTKKPCECDCCPCNPCKTKKRVQKESSEEESEEEAQTIYKSYDPVLKKYIDVKKQDAPRTRSISSNANFHRMMRTNNEQNLNN